LRARAPGPLSGQLYEHHPGGDPGPAVPLSCCLSAAGIRFLSTLSCQGIPPPLRSAYRTACAYPRLRCGPWQGFHVPHAWDPDRAGRPLYPGDGGVRWPSASPWPPPAASQRPVPIIPAQQPSPEMYAW